MVLVVTLISGIIPAIYLSNFKAIETLKGNFSRSKHGFGLETEFFLFNWLFHLFHYWWFNCSQPSKIYDE
jgi:hypothetical protein